jgi:DNA-binding Lrp family transcriptional regulator
MDAIDRNLINSLQEGLPLAKDPYQITGQSLGIERAEVLERIKNLLEAGYIRRLGGIFETSAMGYTSILIGAHVPENIFPETARYINSFSGVTHNYRRTGFLNMWFTFSCQRKEEKAILLKNLQEKFALAVFREFPNLHNFKLRVFFDMTGR